MPIYRNAADLLYTAKDWLLGLAAAAAVGLALIALITAVLPRVWPSGVAFSPWAGLIAVTIFTSTTIHRNRSRRQ